MQSSSLISGVPVVLFRRFGNRPPAATGRTFRRALTAMLCTVAFFAAPFAASQTAVAGDSLAGDLFSEITMSDTIAQEVTSASSVTDNPNPILGAISLSKLFASDQLKVNVQSQRVTVGLVDLLPVSATMPSVKDATLTLSVDAEAQRIDILLPVRTIANESSVNGPGMIKLMAALTSHSNIQLTVANQTLALHTSLVNQGVTVDKIRTVVRQAVVVAADAEPLLAAIENKVQGKVDDLKQTAAVASPAPAATPEPSTPASLSIVGTWSAKTSATDAWAIRLANDGSFVMVHTRGGKNSVSRGQYTVNQNRLTLSESGGVTLKGTLDQTSQKQFAWNLQDDNGKTLTTLAFSKQS